MSDARDPLGIVGTTIAEKYAIESVVGQGGFAVVYRATHILWKRPVAVKVFNALADVSADQRQALLDDFIQEGALLAELSERSSAICQARDVGMLTSPRGLSIPYMVLEWLEGRSLEDLLEAERKAGAPLRSLVDAVHLLDPIAEALALAHKKGIAHRDVKPANVFVLQDETGAVSGVKLLDFGIAKVVQDAQKMGFGKTAGHITSFTPLYGAPEQFDRRHGATGPWTDVFALALVFAEVVSGREPMQGDDLVQLAFAAGNPSTRPTPRTLGVPTSDDVEAVLTKAVAVKPDERFQTAGELWSVLRERVLGESGRSSSRDFARTPVSAPRATTGTEATLLPEDLARTGDAPGSARAIVSEQSPAPAPSTSRAPIFAVVGILAVAALGGGAYAFRAKPSDPARPTASASASAPVAAPSDAGADASVIATSPLDALPDVSAGQCPRGMAYIKGGDFFLGSDEASAPPEWKPVHKVRLGAYCLDIYEVTVEAYKYCSDMGGCLRAGKANLWNGISDAQKRAYDPLCNENDPVVRAKHPMNCVDWEQAQTFCREVRGGRLPTEAEWELAARGPEQRLYPWGDDHPTGKLLNACGPECTAWFAEHAKDDSEGAMYDDADGWPTTAPVGSFPAGKSRFGIYDIVGNVWEWVGDWYAKGYPRTKDPVVDPTGPAKGTERVLRGGSWNGADKTWVKPAFRFKAAPEARSHGYGFRCAKPIATAK